MDDTPRLTILFGLFFLSAILFFSTASWLGAIAMLLSLCLMVYVNGEYSRNHFKTVIESFPSALQKYNYNADDSSLSDDFISGIAINYEEETLAIATRKHRVDEFDVVTLPFSSIVESELREDNETLLKASKGSTIGGALVGGALAGGVGAIVGGMTGSKTGKEKAHQMTLLLVVDDIRNPVYEINFLKNPNGLLKSSPVYDDIRSKATKWHKTISVILNKNKLNTSSN